MIMAFLSSRIRTWVLFAVLLPLFGRLLEKLGVRVADRNPRAGRALATTSSMMRRSRTRGRGRGRRGRRGPGAPR